MSFIVTNTAILSNAAGLKSSSKHVLTVLAQHADRYGKCWPGIDRIGELACLSERAVRYSLRKLESLGLIETQHRTGTSNLYRLTLGQPPKAAPTTLAHAIQVPTVAPMAAVFAPLEPSPFARVPTPAPPPVPLAPTPAKFAPPPRQNLPPNRSVEYIQEIHSAPPKAAPPPPPPASPLCVPDELKTIEPQLLEDFAVVRKTKKKAPTPTRTEAQDLAEQADRAGLTVAQVLRLCIIKGWARFEAAWLPDGYRHSEPVRATAPPPPPPPPQLTPEQLAEQQAAVAVERARLRELVNEMKANLSHKRGDGGRRAI